MNKYLTILLFSLVIMPAAGQSKNFPDDNITRGYYDRPYLRYEAEPGLCEGNFLQLLPIIPYSQTVIQSEASHQTAAQIVEPEDYISWTCDKDADALSLRFSLPDDSHGKGNKGKLNLKVNNEILTEIDLDSYWAWQYNAINNSQTKYPDNNPSQDKFPRMRFDEVYVKLPSPIKQGDTFSLSKSVNDNLPYIIDFVELEMAPEIVTYESISGDKVKYEGDGSTLQNFINSNPGKIIYIPAGTYNITRRIFLNDNNTQIIGAGMWYTTLYFSASPDVQRTASDRGFESYASGITLEGFSMNSSSNMRYFNNNEAFGAGKGLQGSFGRGSVIRNLRIDHFECGAWIGDYGGVAANGLLVEHCRFRNNYADGINLCSGTINSTVTHCSFRNNGDDDMASWSTGNWTKNNTFSYCTAENNWRASSLGFFGGENNQAHHIVVIDAMEGGVRVNADFGGTGFSTNGEFLISDLSIYSSGCYQGKTGENGDHWGNSQPSLLIQPGYAYDINNLRIENIDIYNTRFQAIAIKSNSGKLMNNLEMHNIKVHGVNETDWDFYMASNLVGNGKYSGLEFDTDLDKAMSSIPTRFNFTEDSAGIGLVKNTSLTIIPYKGGIKINGLAGSSHLTVYDSKGRIFRHINTFSESTNVDLPKGLYIVAIDIPKESHKVMIY